jgi:hypothetical protein
VLLKLWLLFDWRRRLLFVVVLQEDVDIQIQIGDGTAWHWNLAIVLLDATECIHTNLDRSH